MAGSEAPAPRRLSTVGRAIAVLDALAAASSELGTNEIARRTGINASTVSRLLATLAEEGLVRRVDHTGRYQLGLRLVALGHAALAGIDLRDVARPHLVALSAATGETATLSVPEDEGAVTVDFVQSPASVQSVARLGRPSVLHATASGKVVLAHRGRLPAGALTPFTERTLTDRDALAREVARTAERGWAEAIGEREQDLNAIAAPIPDASGGLLAILGLQGPASRFGRKAIREAAPQLVDRAARISPTGR